MKTAIFPGSFDPITLGHESVVKRALPLFDRIIVALGINAEKTCMFSIDQRKQWLQTVFSSEPKIEVSTYRGLTVDFCRKMHASYILRGIRNADDFEFERDIARMNAKLNVSIETIFLLAQPELSSIKSSILRDILKNGGDISQFIPDGVEIRL